MKFLVALLIVAVASADHYMVHNDDIFGLPRVTQIFGDIKDSELDDTRRIIGTETVLMDEKHDGLVEKIVEFPKVN